MKNAYILDWTMDDYDGLKNELKEAGFDFEKESDKEHIKVDVDLERVDVFAGIVRRHLNEPFNYVDIKFPRHRLVVVVFRERIYKIDNPGIDKEAREWAISIGLPEEQADWATFY